MHHGKQILKILGWALLVHAVLIGLTVLEVAIYSAFFNTGQETAVYEQHAQKSGPIIGIVAGFALVYFLLHRLIKRSPGFRTLLGLGIPLAYILLDLLMLWVSETDISAHMAMFSASYLSKILAGFLAMKMSIHASSKS